ncbi:ABC transporter ATP-binding protein [Aureliella helgolandensis]|uniref:ABC-type transporter ATP-binding protein EcsA n=1 Tax=Aureliella helgolandensis TaxID=2527968 RepID=A0A518G0R8_9BACT|nr:ABC transporter ATP-binding protein [Aureliella helgolandensis]QDV22198.1 ABC-type transporter ATP-binding protein EcsA [Aureliella helgolandensis]
MNAIEVTDFRKEYGSTVAANGLSFSLPRGTVGALIGPNGAGKTTTIRALCGIIRPTSGALQVAGFDVDQEPLQVKQRVAYVPDDPPLFETLTVWEHMQFIASAYQVRDFVPQAEELLAQLHLEGKRDALASELSRGMRQKVAIACAYLHNPEVLFFDEPLTGLDPAAIRLLKQTMSHRASQGATVLVSSHLLALVEDICKHLIILSRGQCLFSGSIEQAREQYATTGSLEEMFFQITEGATSDE